METMPPDSRYTTVELPPAWTDLQRELRKGLTAPQKSLPCKLFYDERGSKLFERICELPEYYLTRTERGILEEHAGDITARCPSPLTLVELGSGSATKTRYLIAACLRQQAHLEYYPIDVSPSALERGARGLLAEFDNLRVIGLVGEFEAGLAYLEQRSGEPHLVAFLGSTIGNLTEEELESFFAMLRSRLRPSDRFLLGFDLFKGADVLLPAYDDAQGVTAEFNRNILARLNRDFGADFDLSAFAHRAEFNEERSRIEMYLVSTKPQTVHIPGLGLDVTLARGERIHTENSYKHSRQAMERYLQRAGFTVQEEFTDARQMFCLALLR